MEHILKTVYLLLLLWCVAPAARAQLDDGTYYAFPSIKPDQQPDVITIRVLSIGDGIRQFTDEATKKGLDGQYHIAISHTRYALVGIKKGLLNGNWTQYWNNEEEEKGAFKEGKRDGSWWIDTTEGYDEYVFKDGRIVSLLSRYDNGQVIQEQIRDENGKLHGEVVSYYRDGNVRSRLNYVHGVQEGLQYKADQSLETYTLKNGKKVGEYSNMTHKNGLLEKGMLDDEGNKIGTWYYGNGNDYVSKEESYLNGKIHGQRKQYYSNGALWHYDEYMNGKRQGKSIDYDRDDGCPSREYTYRDDKKHGEFKVWYNGTLNKSGVYNEDVLVMEKNYHNGKLTDVSLLDETGRLTRVEAYNKAGKQTYRNATFKKHPSITLKESAAGVIDIEIK